MGIFNSTKERLKQEFTKDMSNLKKDLQKSNSLKVGSKYKKQKNTARGLQRAINRKDKGGLRL